MQKIPTKSAAVKPQVSAPKGVEQYLQELDALLKRNTGSGLHVGEDTSSNSPMYIPGKVANPSGLGDSASSIQQYGDGMTAPIPRERPAPIQEQQPQEEPGVSQLEQFLQQFNETVYPSQFGNTQPQSEGVATMSDGGTLGQDGVVRYSDGTVREYKDPNAQGIASMRDGSIQYSDGTLRKKAPQGIASLQGNRERILMDDGSAQYGRYQPNFTPNVLPGGEQGLISGIFGQDRPITQQYGNVNPIEPTPGHINYGTDIRTKDLSGSQRNFKLPVNAKVIEVLRDDGTRYGTQSGHKGYGNSLLVQLPTGEMIRMSHLNSMIDVQPGQDLPAGTVFGTPGQTGNTTGEHLDLEYYDQNGQIANPGQFSGFSSPEGMRQEVAGQPAPGTQVPRNEVPNFSSQPTPVQQPTVQPPKQGQILGASTQEDPFRRNTGNLLESTINNTLPKNQADLGVSEGITSPQAKLARLDTVATGKAGSPNPIRQLAGNLTEKVGDTLGIPEGTFSELIAGGGTRRTNVANASDGNYKALPNAFANTKYPQNLGGDVQQAADYIKNGTSDALSKAGQGIQGLANTGIASLENVFKPNQAEIKRAIGDVPGTVDAGGNPNFSSLQDTANSKAGTPKNDIRDAFFKQGGSDIFKDFLKPGAADSSGGALSMDLFSNDFFGDLGRITSVFGGSKDLGAATERYVDMEKQKYQPMERMTFDGSVDRSEVDAYNKEVDKYNSDLNNYYNSIRSSVQGVPSSFSPNVQSSAKNVFSSSAPSSRVTSTPALNYSSVSGPQLASFSKPSAKVSSPSANVFTPANANTSTNKGPVYSPAPASRPAPAQAPKPQVFTPSNANTSTNRGAVYTPPPKASTPKPQSKPSSNVFSTVKSFISNIFRR